MNELFLAPTSLPHTAPVEMIEAAAKAGFSGVGLRLWRSPNQPFQPVVGNATLIRDIRSALADTGLGLLDIFSYWIEPTTRLDDFVASFEVAAQLGARYILVLGVDADEARLTQNFAMLCECAATFGLTSAVEFAINRPLSTLRQAERLIADSGSRNAVICVDPINLVRSGGRIEELASIAPELLHYAHFCDGFLDAKSDVSSGIGRLEANRRCMPGEGQLPLHDILDFLPGNITLSVEIPGPQEPQLSAGNHARLAADATRRFLESYERKSRPAAPI